MNVKRVLHHIALPAMAPILFFTIAATPVEVLGCRNRGLLALLVVFAALIVALFSAVIATRRRARGEAGTGWWAASSLVLAVPAVALLFLA